MNTANKTTAAHGGEKPVQPSLVIFTSRAGHVLGVDWARSAYDVAREVLGLDAPQTAPPFSGPFLCPSGWQEKDATVAHFDDGGNEVECRREEESDKAAAIEGGSEA